jgi:hypothetical protein
MENIAFKRFKNIKYPVDLSKILPPEYIFEYHDETKFERNYFKSEDGWEIMDKEQFDVEFIKNDLLFKKHTDDLEAINAAKLINMVQVEQKVKADLKDEYRLWHEFLDWKKQMEAAKVLAKQEKVQQLWDIQQGKV